MAQINPPPSETTPTNFTGRSQGRPVDRTGEILFGGLANALTGAVQVADTAVKNRIESDVYSMFDEQTDQLVPLSQDFQAGQGLGDEDVPAEIGSSHNNLRRLQSAHSSGVLSDTAYYTRLQAESKRLRAKYPGYRDHVDSMIQSVTGVRPANALRRALQSEMNTLNAERIKTARDRQRTVEEALQKGWVTLEQLEGKTWDQVQGIIWRGMSHHGQNEKLKHDLSTEEAVTGANKERARILAVSEGNRLMSQVLDSGMSVIGNTHEDVIARVDQLIQNPESISQDELTELVGGVKRMKLSISARIDTMLSQPEYNSLSESDRKAVRDRLLSHVDLLEEAIGAEDWTLVKHNANVTQAIAEQGARDLVQTDMFSRQISIMRELGAPPDSIRDLIITHGVSTLGATIATQEVMKMATGDSRASGRKMLETLVQSDAPQDLIDGAFNKIVDIITNAEVHPPEVRANVARAFFKDQDFMAEIDPESRKNVFYRYASRDITQSIAELAKSDPSLWDAYTGWVERNTLSLFQEEINTVAGNISRAAEQTDTPQGQFLRYNPDTNEFELPARGSESFKLFKGRENRGMMGGALSGAINYDRLEGKLQPLNQLLRTVEPIVSEEGGDMSEFVKSIFSGTSIDVEQIVPSEGEVEGGTGEEEVRGSAATDTFTDVFNEEEFDQDISKVIPQITPTFHGIKKLEGKNTRVGEPTPAEMQANMAAMTGGPVRDISDLAEYSRGMMPEVKGFVIHHTGGRGKAEDVVSVLNNRGLGVQYVIERDGSIVQTLPDGARGAHMKNSEINDLNNSNTIGVEIIAADENDFLPVQVEAAKRLYIHLLDKYPDIGSNVYGHGEVNSHKREKEAWPAVMGIKEMLESGSTSS